MGFYNVDVFIAGPPVETLAHDDFVRVERIGECVEIEIEIPGRYHCACSALTDLRCAGCRTSLCAKCYRTQGHDCNDD